MSDSDEDSSANDMPLDQQMARWMFGDALAEEELDKVMNVQGISHSTCSYLLN